MILLTAVPFGDAVLGTGALVGISPYLLLQWIVPVATEAPELVVAFVLLTHGRGGQSVAVLLAGAVSQYTLALGTLPIAYRRRRRRRAAAAGRTRAGRAVRAVGVALYAVAALVTLRLSRGDASIMLVLFSLQFLLPAVLTRLPCAVAFLALAIDVLVSERRHLRALFRALFPGRGGDGPPQGGFEVAAVARRGRSRTRSPAAAAARRCRRRRGRWAARARACRRPARAARSPRIVRLTAALPEVARLAVEQLKRSAHPGARRGSGASPASGPIVEPVARQAEQREPRPAAASIEPAR